MDHQHRGNKLWSKGVDYDDTVSDVFISDLPVRPRQVQHQFNITAATANHRRSSDPFMSFERDMQRLGADFDDVRQNLAFSTHSLLTSDASVLPPNHTTSHSLLVTPVPTATSNTHTMNAVNTTLPLPPPRIRTDTSGDHDGVDRESPCSTSSQAISAVSSTINKRLSSLRDKLYKLQQDDTGDADSEDYVDDTELTLPTHVRKGGRAAAPITAVDEDDEDTGIALSLPSTRAQSTSFSDKYEQYMQRYHGAPTSHLISNTSRTRRSSDAGACAYRHLGDNSTPTALNAAAHNASSQSVPDYMSNRSAQRSRDSAQYMVSKIQQKSKELFQNRDHPASFESKAMTPKAAAHDSASKQPLSTFDEQLNETWTRAQLKLQKMKHMNQRLNQSVKTSSSPQESRAYHVNELPSPSTPLNTHHQHHANSTVQTDTASVERPSLHQPPLAKVTHDRGVQVCVPMTCDNCQRRMSSNPMMETQETTTTYDNYRKQLNVSRDILHVPHHVVNATLPLPSLSASPTSEPPAPPPQTSQQRFTDSQRKQLINDLQNMHQHQHQHELHDAHEQPHNAEQAPATEQPSPNVFQNKSSSLREKLNNLKKTLQNYEEKLQN